MSINRTLVYLSPLQIALITWCWCGHCHNLCPSRYNSTWCHDRRCRTKSPASLRSVLGVSAQPLLWPGVSVWRQTQQEHTLWKQRTALQTFKLLHTPRQAFTTESNLSFSLTYSSTKDNQPTNQHNSSTTPTHTNLIHPNHSQINLAKQYQNMWEFRSSGMWSHTSRLLCTNVLKEHTAFIFKGWRGKIILPWQLREDIPSKYWENSTPVADFCSDLKKTTISSSSYTNKQKLLSWKHHSRQASPIVSKFTGMILTVRHFPVSCNTIFIHILTCMTFDILGPYILHH